MYVHFCDFCDPQKKSLNESCVKKVVDTYYGEGIDLEQKGEVLFFFAFNSRSIRYPEELGFLIAKESLEYGSFQKEYDHEVKKIKDFSLFEYVIYLSGKLGEEESEISKILTVAHECKHLIQDLGVENSLLKDLLLKKYFKLKCQYPNKHYRTILNRNMFYRNMPSEYDAFRESKRMAFKICGKENTEKFLDHEINEHKNRLIYTRCDSAGLSDEIVKLTYWEHTKAINVKELFDFKKEFGNIWNKYNQAIKTEIKKISGKSGEQRNEKEKDLLEAYNFLCSKS